MGIVLASQEPDFERIIRSTLSQFPPNCLTCARDANQAISHAQSDACLLIVSPELHGPETLKDTCGGISGPNTGCDQIMRILHSEGRHNKLPIIVLGRGRYMPSRFHLPPHAILNGLDILRNYTADFSNTVNTALNGRCNRCDKHAGHHPSL